MPRARFGPVLSVFSSPGAGLLWGLGVALLLWLALPAGLLPLLSSGPQMPMLDAARAHLPELVAYLLLFGLPVGLALERWSVCVRRQNRHARLLAWPARW